MPNHVLPVLFMLLSTFSLSLTGLLTQYLSHIVHHPIGIFTFYYSGAIFTGCNEVDPLSLAAEKHVVFFVDPCRLYCGQSALFYLCIAIPFAGGKRRAIQYWSTLHSFIGKVVMGWSIGLAHGAECVHYLRWSGYAGR